MYACLCEAFTLGTLHEGDAWIGSVRLRLRVRVRAGDMVWRRKGDGRRRDVSETGEGIHEGMRGGEARLGWGRRRRRRMRMRRRDGGRDINIKRREMERAV